MALWLSDAIRRDVWRGRHHPGHNHALSLTVVPSSETRDDRLAGWLTGLPDWVGAVLEKAPKGLHTRCLPLGFYSHAPGPVGPVSSGVAVLVFFSCCQFEHSCAFGFGVRFAPSCQSLVSLSLLLLLFPACFFGRAFLLPSFSLGSFHPFVLSYCSRACSMGLLFLRESSGFGCHPSQPTQWRDDEQTMIDDGERVRERESLGGAWCPVIFCRKTKARKSPPGKAACGLWCILSTA